MTFQEIQSKIETAKTLDFGTILNNCIELFKKVWVQGLIILKLSAVITAPLLFVIYIPIIALGISAEALGETDFAIFGSMLGLVFVLVFIAVIVAMITISTALKAAFYRIVKYKDLNEMGTDDYFFFLKKPYLKKTIAFSLAYAGIAILAAMLCYLPLIYAIVPLSLMLTIYAFNPDLKISEIVTLGFNLGNKKWGITFGLMLVVGFLSLFLGFLMCGIGLYFLLSINYLVQYFIYKDVVGFDGTDDNEEALMYIENL